MGKRLSSSSKPKAVGYVRVSTGKQADKGGSLAVQRDRIVEYAVLNGFNLVGVFEDAGISGAKGEDERPGFAAALDAIRGGGASVLVVTDADRFARDADTAGHARVEIKRAGGRVVVLSEVDAGVELVAVRQLLAVLEREKVRARMRTWSAARLAKGLHMGPAPYGFRIGPNGTLEEEPTEAPVLARIAALRASGATLRAVAETLDAEGVPARGGRGWNQMTVSKIEKRGTR
jgi:DNA invertase Pin-like site-specific DNA recombinase